MCCILAFLRNKTYSVKNIDHVLCKKHHDLYINKGYKKNEATSLKATYYYSKKLGGIIYFIPNTKP